MTLYREHFQQLTFKSVQARRLRAEQRARETEAMKAKRDDHAQGGMA
jgi:hypothetical protein